VSLNLSRAAFNLAVSLTSTVKRGTPAVCWKQMMKHSLTNFHVFEILWVFQVTGTFWRYFFFFLYFSHELIYNYLARIRLCHTAAILSRETKKALFHHAEPRSQNRGGEAKRGKTKLFWSPGTIWPLCDKGESPFNFTNIRHIRLDELYEQVERQTCSFSCLSLSRSPQSLNEVWGFFFRFNSRDMDFFWVVLVY